MLDNPTETAKRKAAFAKFFFGDPELPQHFYLKTGDIPDIHMGMYRALSENYKFHYVTSPRDFAKTTVIRINVLYSVYYQLEPHILLIGKIEQGGKSMLRALKYEIKNNPKLRAVYGVLHSDERDKEWSAHEARLTNGVFIRSIGMEGDCRGGLDQGWRYTLVLGDDVQSMKTMRMPAKLESNVEYWERDVEYSIDNVFGKVIYLGNMLGPNCLLEHLTKDKKYHGTSFHSMVDADGKPDHIKGRSTWESKWPTKVLRAEAKEMAAKGKLHVFLAERQNIITDALAKNLKGYKFHQMEFKRENGQNLLYGDFPDPIPVYTHCWVDPAFGMEANHDERAIVISAKGRVLMRSGNTGELFHMNLLWILEYIYNHMNPLDVIDFVLDKHKQYFFNSVVIETIGGQKIYESMMHRGVVGDKFFSQNPFSPIFIGSHKYDKKDRIWTGLQPLCSMGQFLIRPSMSELINECDNFARISSPHLLDAIEFGNSASTVCVQEVFQPKQPERRRFDRYKKEEPRNGMWGWCPKNLSEVGIN